MTRRPGVGPWLTAGSISLGYFVFSWVWIIGTGRLVDPLATRYGWDPATFELAKGLVFVTATAALLYLTLRRFRRELTTTERRWRSLADGTSDGIVVVRLDPHPVVLYRNPALLRMLGVDGVALDRDPTLLSRVTSGTIPLLRDLAAPVPDARPCQVRTEDGTRRWIQVRLTMTTDHTGARLLQAATTDLTALVEHELALERALVAERTATEVLRRADAANQRFLTATSHELRTPVTVTLGAAQTLQRFQGQLDGPEHQQLVDAAVVHAERLGRLITRLFELDRLERGIARARIEHLDVGSTVRALLAGHAVGARTTLHAPETLVLPFDRGHLEQLLGNLLDNVEKYAPEGPVELELWSEADRWGLVLTDHGPGIAEQDRAQLFRPFSRLDDLHPQPGTGVGLALVARLIDLHGGTITADGQDGLRLSVELPLVSVGATTNGALAVAAGDPG